MSGVQDSRAHFSNEFWNTLVREKDSSCITMGGILANKWPEEVCFWKHTILRGISDFLGPKVSNFERKRDGTRWVGQGEFETRK